jgi:hypothetical protein
MSDLREALEASFKEAEAEAPQVQEAPAEIVETDDIAEAAKAERARDEAGRFAKGEQAQAAPQVDAPQVEAPPPRRAPSSWKPAAQEAFLKADRGEALTADEIKLLTQEAERRENDFHKGVSEFKTHSERAKAYDQAIAPFQQHLQNLGVDAPTAITALMRADYTLRNSDPMTKAQYFRQLANEYGIDLNMEVPQVDPQTQFLMNQLNELRQQQQLWQNQFTQQEQTRANQELSQFSQADKPHFDAVRNDMADLLETGKAKDLQEAYEMAVWMRPDIRQTLLDQQRAEAQRKAIDQAQAQRAKAASVSVKGSSPMSGGVQPNLKGSLRDILAQQFADN